MATIRTFGLLVGLASLYCQPAAAVSNDTVLPEPLFLDFTAQEVATNTSWMPVFEPWASSYINAIRDGRYGDAIWARYHIGGDVRSGLIDTGSRNITVLESLEEDAVGYRVEDPELYMEAISLYAKTSASDGHMEVLDLLSRIGQQDASVLRARVTFTTTCSREFLARQSDCLQLLRSMPKRRAYLGNIRGVASSGNCRLRVGPYRTGADMSYVAIYAVGRLIEYDCAYAPSNVYVSGYSPYNSGHRKVCLSSKNSGCSG